MQSPLLQYEQRFGPKKTVAEETADGKMEIQRNGSALSNFDSLVKAALDKQFGKNKWNT